VCDERRNNKCVLRCTSIQQASVASHSRDNRFSYESNPSLFSSLPIACSDMPQHTPGSFKAALIHTTYLIKVSNFYVRI